MLTGLKEAASTMQWTLCPLQFGFAPDSIASADSKISYANVTFIWVNAATLVLTTGLSP